MASPAYTRFMSTPLTIARALVIGFIGISLGACASVPDASSNATPRVSPVPSEPHPSAIPSPETDRVGVLRVWQLCLLLDTETEDYELLLPGGYRQETRDGRVHILNRQGVVIGVEGERIGVDGETGEGGSFCMLGPQMEATRIVPIQSASS
jgi:hypothetical protein